MKTRILSGIVLGVITVSSLLVGGVYMFCICLAISILGMSEYYKVVGLQKNILGIIGYISAVSCYAYLFAGHSEILLFCLIISAMAMLAAYVLTFPGTGIDDVVKAFWGIIYVPVMLSYIYQTRMMEHGECMAWLIFICSWGNDTFAYFTGVLFGKHKLAPKLSPKKTIEGAIGGIVGASAVGAGFGFLMKTYIGRDMTLVFAVASAIGAIVAVFGDLAASAVKRNYNVKDYGKIIPGHGGILDRYDSVIFTAPIIYWVLYFIS